MSELAAPAYPGAGQSGAEVLLAAANAPQQMEAGAGIDYPARQQKGGLDE